MAKNRNNSIKQVIIYFAVEHYVSKKKTDMAYKTFNRSCALQDIPVMLECMRSILMNGDLKVKRIHNLGVYEDLGDKIRVLNEF